MFQVSVCWNAHIALGLDPTNFDSNVYEVTLAYKSGFIYHDVVLRDGVNGNIGAQTPGYKYFYPGKFEHSGDS